MSDNCQTTVKNYWDLPVKSRFRMVLDLDGVGSLRLFMPGIFSVGVFLSYVLYTLYGSNSTVLYVLQYMYLRRSVRTYIRIVLYLLS